MYTRLLSRTIKIKIQETNVQYNYYVPLNEKVFFVHHLVTLGKIVPEGGVGWVSLTKTIRTNPKNFKVLTPV